MSPVSAPPSKLMLAPPATSVKLPVMFGPNITGAAQLDTNETGKGLIFFAEGAFGQYVSSAPNAYASYASDVTREIHGNFTLDAARSSSTYGASTVVQPPALMALALIKI